MPLYNCTSCPGPVEIQPEIPRGQTVACPSCGTPVASGQRSYKRDFEAYRGQSFVAPKKARTAYVVVASGRSPAAPVRTTWPGPNLSANVTHVPNLMSAAWLGAGAGTIALAYNDLDIGRPGVMEGLLVDCPEAVGKPNVISHFGAVRVKLVAAHKLTDIAEATGEAAAALCILRESRIGTLTLAGFDMEWGMHVHSGPGIDQIWSRSLGGRNQYLIVEAKGPNQSTNPNAYMPPDFDQMSIRWIMHNLDTMSRNHGGVAANIIRDLNVATGYPLAELPGRLQILLWRHRHERTCERRPLRHRRDRQVASGRDAPLQPIRIHAAYEPRPLSSRLAAPCAQLLVALSVP